MVAMVRRWAIAGAAVIAGLSFFTVVWPAVSSATECGWGTVYDAPSNTCVAAPAPPPPPAWNGDLTPYFSVGTCVPIPIPFAPSVCAGI